MQKRSLLKLTFLTMCTLGLYEIFWLMRSRDEMVTKFQAQIPKSRLVPAIKFLQLAAFFALASLVILFIPASITNSDSLASYRTNIITVCPSETSSAQPCQKKAVRYHVTNHTTYILTGVVLGIIVIMTTLYLVYMGRWVALYVASVEKITGAQFSTMLSTLAWTGIVPVLGMLYVQDAFNRMDNTLAARKSTTG